MTQFSVNFVVNVDHLQWIKNNYSKLFFHPSDRSFDFNHNDFYTKDYADNSYYYKWDERREEFIKNVDNAIKSSIQEYYEIDDSEDEEEIIKFKKEIELITNEFEDFIKIRNQYTEEVKKYEHLYKDVLNIYLDSFPNFDLNYRYHQEDMWIIELDSFNYSAKMNDSDYDENYEYVCNPFFMIVFLQKYIRHFGLANSIKFKYFENHDNLEKCAGVIDVDYFVVNIVSLKQLMNIDLTTVPKY